MTKDSRTLALFCGIDIPIPECQLILHQPSIKEISYIGKNTFFTGVQCLAINKKMVVSKDEKDLFDINNFQIFMTVMKEDSVKGEKECIKQVMNLIFPNYKISFTPNSIIFIQEGQNEIITVDESNFEFLQEVVKEVFCLNSQSLGQNLDFNPADEQARKIAEKLQRGRQRVAAQKGESDSDIFVQYASILTVGLHSMSLEDCLNLTMFQLLDLIERYSLYTDWDIDIRARLAGANSDDTPDNWMKNIH